MIDEPEIKLLEQVRTELLAAQKAARPGCDCETCVCVRRARECLDRALYPDDYAEPEAVNADVQRDCDEFHEKNDERRTR